jgi:hypothetical protein
MTSVISAHRSAYRRATTRGTRGKHVETCSPRDARHARERARSIDRSIARRSDRKERRSGEEW